MKSHFVLLGIYILLFSVPYGARAAVTTPTDFKTMVGLLNGIIDILIPLIFSLTVVFMLWGIVKAWILNSGNEEEIKNGRNTAIVGIMVFVVVTSIWAILRLLRTSFFGV